MSLDAIKQVNEAEETAKQHKADAKALAKKLVADAERDGRELVESTRNKTAAEVKQFMTEAEQKAAVSAEEVLAETKRACETLHTQAKGRLDQAASLIVERVVKI